MYKVAYFFCINPDKDHVASGGMDICNEIYDLKETDIVVNGKIDSKQLDEREGVSVFKHKALKDIGDLPIW